MSQISKGNTLNIAVEKQPERPKATTTDRHMGLLRFGEEFGSFFLKNNSKAKCTIKRI